MRLSILLKNILQIPPEIDCDITRLSLDSRHVQANDLFFAIKGTHLDGRKYITNAIAQGAAAILIDADAPNQPITWLEAKALIPIYGLQQQLGHIAAAFYNYPAKKLRIIGITGTSGKTSCTHFIAQILESMQIPCGIIGSLGNGFCDALSEAGLTTPDAITLQSTLSQFIAQGAKAVAMEVSSHSIDQGRVNGMDFETGIFTNLTQDHLDYHGDMETYAKVKRRFLAEFPIKQSIINVDDAYGRKWINELAPHQSTYAYGTCFASAQFIPKNIPFIYAENLQLSLQGIKAVAHTPWGSGDMLLPLVGEFNVANALAVLTALCLYGIPFADVLKHLTQLKSVPGRMQTLGGNGKPLVFVDHAHKPDALEKVLKTLRKYTQGKVICVFGCGGERDRGKRPLMAAIAEQYADVVIVTNDNPRHEEPADIVAQILQGFSQPERVSVELDRSKAIRNSIQYASTQDCILIAGKGAEHYQYIGNDKFPFDDVEKVREFL